MAVTQNKDLLAYEPDLFRDVPWIGQQIAAFEDGVKTGTTLTTASVNLITRGVQAGDVALVDEVPFEVIEVVDANTLNLSLLRGSGDDAALPGEDGQSLGVVVRSFGPQIASLQESLLDVLQPADPSRTPVTVDMIVNVQVLGRLVALGTLHRVYAAAAALTSENKTIDAKASLYREAFARAFRSSTIHVDANGDGSGDSVIRPGTTRLHRA